MQPRCYSQEPTRINEYERFREYEYSCNEDSDIPRTGWKIIRPYIATSLRYSEQYGHNCAFRYSAMTTLCWLGRYHTMTLPDSILSLVRVLDNPLAIALNDGGVGRQ